MSQKLARPRRSASRRKTVDSVVRDRSCVQKLRARAVPDALNTETQAVAVL